MASNRYAALLHQPVITTADAVRAYGGDRRAAVQMLDYLRRTERVVKVRRGLYVPGPAANPEWRASLDPYVIAAHIRPEATIAFHSALVVAGVAQNPSERIIHYAVERRLPPFEALGLRFVPFTMAPKHLERATERVARWGQVIRVTRPEWTVAMCCYLPSRAGGFEEILLSSEGFPRMDMKELLFAAQAQGSPAVVNRVAFLAWAHRRRWRVQREELAAFRSRLSRPTSFGSGESGRGLLYREWKVTIPASMKELLDDDDQGTR
jgi:predicted transcriptional regulator of viral defense system